MTSHCSRVRFAGILACLAVAVGAMVVTEHRPAGADSDAVAVDRQGYVSDQPVDPYAGANSQANGTQPDQLSIHVSAAGGRTVAHSFVHLSFDGLPDGAKLSGATVTLTPDTSSTNNANTSAAILSACALTSPLPDNVTPSNAPKFDCAAASATGTRVDKTAANSPWTFDLTKLVQYWNANGNTGAAIIPVAATETWSLSFDKTLTAASDSYTVAPAASDSDAASVSEASPAPAAADSGQSGILGLASSAPSPTASDTGSAFAPATAPAPTATPEFNAAPRGSVRTVPGTRSSAWVWLMLAALVTAALLAARPVVAIATAGAGHVKAAVAAQFQQHARGLATSMVVVGWTVMYMVYSIVVTPAPRVIAGPASSSGASSHTAPGQTFDASGNLVDTSPGGAAATGSAGAGTRSGASTAAVGGSGVRRSIQNPSEASLPAAARLYSGADDTVGITKDKITLCGHTALVFGPAFDIKASDLNVFWQNLNAKGGIFGRTFDVTWNDDTYQPGPAVTAAQKCKDANTFMLLGGIGFDQIPAVRVWAEQNHMLYLHHVAVRRGSAGLRYSFTGLPSVEEMGQLFGQLAVQKYQGHKIAILWRNSSNWQPGRDEFRKVVQAAGIPIVYDRAVSSNQANYTQQLVEANAAGADVVFAWENALASTEMIQQAKKQNFNFHWLLFPFNLTLQGIGADALNPPLDGVAAWPAYNFNDHGGPYSSYAADLAEFENEYKQWDSGAKLDGPGGDLLFLAWAGFKQLADLFQQCGPDCTRNKMAAVMINGYHRTVTPNCDADFTGGDHHHAAPHMDIFTTVARPGGDAKWVPTQRCLARL